MEDDYLADCLPPGYVKAMPRGIPSSEVLAQMRDIERAYASAGPDDESDRISWKESK